MRPLALVALLGLAAPATAQEPQFTPEDEKLMVACIEAAAAHGADTGGELDQPVAPGTIDQPRRTSDCIGAASGPCMEEPGGYSTVGMSQCLARETDWWDGELNARYARLRDGLDEESALALKDAQRAWIAWRDSKCEFEYIYWREGTIRSTYYGACMLDVTAARAIDLIDYSDWI